MSRFEKNSSVYQLWNNLQKKMNIEYQVEQIQVKQGRLENLSSGE